MTELTQLLPWANLGWGAIVTIVVVMILTGRLVPKSQNDRAWEVADAEREARQEAMLALAAQREQIAGLYTAVHATLSAVTKSSKES